MTSSVPQSSLWLNRSVLVTGHTGFKGSWLTAWLGSMGATVHGLSLDPLTTPNMFEVAQTAEYLASDTRGDIVDFEVVHSALEAAQPSVIFHLAAQPLVKRSYADPVGTVRTNVLGTTNLLDSIRRVPSVEVAVVVTTDKVYKNYEWHFPYRENDELGGSDLYSSSKACVELITEAFRTAFFHQMHVQVPTVRAGNVIGGGDWSEDRLVPDLLRCVESGHPPTLRYPNAVRPWQHVLEPLCGYLVLAEKLLSVDPGQNLPKSWNFGPRPADFLTVRELAKRVLFASRLDPKSIVTYSADERESSMLTLDSSLARNLLRWEPRWDLERAVAATLEWHAGWRAGDNLKLLTELQIAEYSSSEVST